MSRARVTVGVAITLVAVTAGAVTLLLNGLDGSDNHIAVTEAEGCDQNAPYDTLIVGTGPGVGLRVETSDSGPDRHVVSRVTDPEGVLLGKWEEILKDRTRYYRESTPDNPDVYGEWLVDGVDQGRPTPLLCLSPSTAPSASVDEPHFTAERFLSEAEGSQREEYWADSAGRPTRMRRTIFPPEYDGVTNTETGVLEFTYSGHGEANTITAPCASAASGQAGNPGLMRDCISLFAMKDSLRGAGTLNWGLDTAITSWDGVTIGGTPQRITKLLLGSKGLAGSIDDGWRWFSGLTHLDLSGNNLTGSIPAALAKLELTTLKLAGNSLTGCIPLGLQDVPTNDLSSLNLLFCKPPAPSPTAWAVGESTFQLTWPAVPNTSAYWLRYYWEGSPGIATNVSHEITATEYSVGGLQCDTEYRFRLSAMGSGTVYAAAWGDAWEADATTGPCVTPVFGEEAYAFRVPESRPVGHFVVRTAATDPNGDRVTYRITSGNDDGLFTIEATTGAILLAKSLDYETTSSYTLTVEARDGSGGVGRTTVTITVTDVAE